MVSVKRTELRISKSERETVRYVEIFIFAFSSSFCRNLEMGKAGSGELILAPLIWACRALTILQKNLSPMIIRRQEGGFVSLFRKLFLGFIYSTINRGFGR